MGNTCLGTDHTLAGMWTNRLAPLEQVGVQMGTAPEEGLQGVLQGAWVPQDPATAPRRGPRGFAGGGAPCSCGRNMGLPAWH